MKAIWNNRVIAESDKTVVVENNHYFGPESVKMEFLRPSGHTYQCRWKGLADYYDVVVDGKTNPERRLGIPRTDGAGKSHQGTFCVLERRGSRRVKLRILPPCQQVIRCSSTIYECGEELDEVCRGARVRS